jgi:hypothetical protein
MQGACQGLTTCSGPAAGEFQAAASKHTLLCHMLLLLLLQLYLSYESIHGTNRESSHLRSNPKP